jgi:hypothetical protein
LYSCLYAAHQRNRAILLLIVEEERTVRKPTDKVIAPVLLDNPVLSHATLYQKLGYCINFTVSTSSDPSFPLTLHSSLQPLAFARGDYGFQFSESHGFRFFEGFCPM